MRLGDFSCGYRRGTPVVSGVSLELEVGSFSAIVGPNGVGKSSLLRGLAGLLPWSAGEVSLFGRPLSSFNGRELSRSVALMTSKAPQLNVSVVDYVMLGRTPFRPLLSISDSRADLDMANDAISGLGICHLKSIPMARLSDGQRQLASLARAMAQQPKLLLLDEPTSNLDPRNAELVLSSVRGLCQNRGVTAVAVLHDVNSALRWADYAAVMAERKVLAFGAARDVLTPSNLSAAFGAPFEWREAILPSSDLRS